MNTNDNAIRHYIYTHFGAQTVPPTCLKIAGFFGITIAEAENALKRLADAHQIALAPGSHSIWMAHPYSGIPTHYTAAIGGKTYSGN